MRISTTTLESYRLWLDPEQEWMPESDLIDSIKGVWKPNAKVLFGSAFGAILEHPDHYRVPGGYRVTPRGSDRPIDIGDDIMGPMLALIDRPRTVFEAKATKRYGAHTVVAKADQLLGSRLIETKSTQSYDFEKYAQSCQWRFMVDIFEPSLVTYHVCCLYESANGTIEPRGIESFNLYPYAALHQDCVDLLASFVTYVERRGLVGHLQRKGNDAMDSHDERPYGWGHCCVCGADCEEDDYDEDKRVSICPACRAYRQAQSADEQQAAEVFAKR